MQPFFWAGKHAGQRKPHRLITEGLSTFNQFFPVELVQKVGVQKYFFFSNSLVCFQQRHVTGEQHQVLHLCVSSCTVYTDHQVCLEINVFNTRTHSWVCAFPLIKAEHLHKYSTFQWDSSLRTLDSNNEDIRTWGYWIVLNFICSQQRKPLGCDSLGLFEILQNDELHLEEHLSLYWLRSEPRMFTWGVITECYSLYYKKKEGKRCLVGIMPCNIKASTGTSGLITNTFDYDLYIQDLVFLLPPCNLFIGSLVRAHYLHSLLFWQLLAQLSKTSMIWFMTFLGLSLGLQLGSSFISNSLKQF